MGDAQLTTLETEIERLKSLKLLDQERVDRAVLDLSRRQALVERRQKELANIPSPKGSARAPTTDDFTGSVTPNGPLPPSHPDRPSMTWSCPVPRALASISRMPRRSWAAKSFATIRG